MAGCRARCLDQCSVSDDDRNGLPGDLLRSWASTVFGLAQDPLGYLRRDKSLLVVLNGAGGPPTGRFDDAPSNLARFRDGTELVKVQAEPREFGGVSSGKRVSGCSGPAGRSCRAGHRPTRTAAAPP